ncbi:hypothetical protein HJC99_05445 [Candidatus Saccharibacteria bacterium]|nr:hypothetical protein [Candidatus Saccharibacteria bacterium]
MTTLLDSRASRLEEFVRQVEWFAVMAFSELEKRYANGDRRFKVELVICRSGASGLELLTLQRLFTDRLAAEVHLMPFVSVHASYLITFDEATGQNNVDTSYMVYRLTVD